MGPTSRSPEHGTLFLVDPTPLARWAHDVDWVWVEDDGDLRAETRPFYPIVDGVGFFPPYHPSVWGAPWTVEDPATVGEDLTLWEGNDPSGAPRRAAGDPCRPPPLKRAITISGMLREATLADELNWWLALGGRGYVTTSMAPTLADPVTAEEMVEALVALQTDEHLDEVVVTYAGHGLDGALLLGDATTYGQVTLDELVSALAPVKTDRLVLVLDACESGSIATALPARLKAAGMVSTEIVVHAAVPVGILAYDVGTEGGMFSRALGDAVTAIPEEDPIPWAELNLGTYHENAPIPESTLTTTPSTLPTTTTTPPASYSLDPQQEVVGLQERCRPAILLSTHPETGECLAAWIDDQAYDRRTTLDGIGFGEDDGLLEMQDEDGAWVQVSWIWWDDDAVRTVLPMRVHGFPSNGHSPDLEAPVDGTYLIRATRTGGLTSDPQPVRLEYQVYEQTWIPTVFPDDFPDWVELWHPYTDGGTIQLSQTWNASREGSPIPEDLASLDRDASEPHRTTNAVLGVGAWIYELAPGERDLATSYDDAEPSTLYWGFRAGFPSDEVRPDTWGTTLIYD